MIEGEVMIYAAASIIVDDRNRLLMVEQIDEHAMTHWTVPTGRKENGEADIECCVRETYEETGYRVIVKDHLFRKEKVHEYQVEYFRCEIVGGEMCLHDPDEKIIKVEWVSKKRLQTIKLTFEEDRDYLTSLLV